MDVELISRASVFFSLKDAWNELAGNFKSPLLRHEWCASNIAVFCSPPDRLATFVVRSNGKIRAAAPLKIVHHSRVPRLESLSAYELGEPSGFLYDSDEALTVLVKAIFRSGYSLALHRFSVDGREMELMKDLVPRRALYSQGRGNSSYTVPLQPTWQSFEATISAGRRSDLRRYKRRAERFGDLQFEAVSPNRQALDRYLEEFFQVEASGWKGRSGSAILMSPLRMRFFTEYARTIAEQGMLRMYFLRIDGRTAAARFAVECGNRLWDLKMGYDESLGECSPGVLLTQETMRDAIDRGLEAHEFLGKAEAWERHWPCEQNDLTSIRIYPFSINGGLSVLRDGYQFASKRVFSETNAES